MPGESDGETERSEEAFRRWVRYRLYRAILRAARKEQARRNHMIAEGYDV